MKTIVLYARVSKDETDPEGKQYQEPENQLQPLREFCKSMNWEIKHEYIDRASGGDSNRPEFQKMMAEARQHHFDIILIWALDRFSREPLMNTLKYIQDLKKHNVGLKSYTESWVDTTQEGIAELLLAIFAWVASEERRKISQRTKAAIQRLKNIGKYTGGRPKKRPPQDKPSIKSHP